jgi:hypothetical protein
MSLTYINDYPEAKPQAFLRSLRKGDRIIFRGLEGGKEVIFRRLPSDGKNLPSDKDHGFLLYISYNDVRLVRLFETEEEVQRKWEEINVDIFRRIVKYIPKIGGRKITDCGGLYKLFEEAKKGRSSKFSRVMRALSRRLKTLPL